MKIEENILLKDFTTMRVGGPARFFVRVTTEEHLIEALSFARGKKLPIFILGGGSNLIVSDDGFDGLVIKIELTGIVTTEKDGEIFVEAMAGENWDTVVEYTVTHGFAGLENLSWIPGSVGATPVQNIGAYGSEVKDTITHVHAIHSETGEKKIFSNAECAFAYRDSFFKTPEGKKYIVTTVTFHLNDKGSANISYKDLATHFSEKGKTNPTIAEVRDAVIEIRTGKLPNLKELGTAGSFFKNPIVTPAQFLELQKKFPEIPKYPTGDGMIKTSAAWLLDKVCGFKGYREGAVGVYQNQALVLVNFGNASAKEIEELSQKMKSCVEEKTGIILEEEVVTLG